MRGCVLSIGGCEGEPSDNGHVAMLESVQRRSLQNVSLNPNDALTEFKFVPLATNNSVSQMAMGYQSRYIQQHV